MGATVSEKKDKVLEHYSLEKERINKNLKSVKDFLPKLEVDEIYRTVLMDNLTSISTDVQHMNDNEYPIAVLANWNNGKSTFLNALIGEDILPMKNKSYTSEITRIRYGAEPKLIIEYLNSEKEEIPLKGKLNSSFLIDYVTVDGSSLQDREIQEIIIEYPLDIFEEGIVLIDTPGVNSINDMHDKVTFNVIPNAKAIIMLVKSDSAGGKEDVEFLKKILTGRKPKEFDIIFVINKCDTISKEDLEDAEDSLRRALDSVTGPDGNQLLYDYKICSVSSYYELQYKLFKNARISFDDLLDDEKLFKARMNGEEDVETLTDISKFRDLKQVLNESFMGLDTTKQYISSIDSKMYNFCVKEISAYLEQTKEALQNDKDLKELQEEEKRIQEVLKKTQIEKDEIIDEFEANFNEFEKQFDYDGAHDWRRLVKGNMSYFISQNEWKDLQKEDGKIIVEELKFEIQREYYKTFDEVNSYMERLMSQYNQRLLTLVKNANLNISSISSGGLDPSIHSEFDTDKLMYNSGMAVGGIAGAAAGASAGALIGSVVPGIGTAVGAIVGGVIGLIPGGYIGAEGKAKDKLIEKVMPQIEDQVDHAFSEQYNSIIDKANALKTQATTHFQAIIDEHRRVIENSYQKVVQTKQMKAEEIERILATIDGNIEELNGIIDNLHPKDNKEVKKKEELV